ncbi:MAG TPA: ABC transporter permease [Cyclobacteriaceae bacterium]|nr:ABC transporter permease [Cyclobacteriaceae bacterium]
MNTPPKLFLQFFRWYCHPKLSKYIEGDLMELYDERVKQLGKRKANIKFIIDVLLLFKPGIIRPAKEHRNVNHYAMYKSYFKISWRNLIRNKVYAAINIGGLALGMSVALLIGLWIYDELSFNKYHENYNHIARVMQRMTVNGSTGESKYLPFPLGPELRESYQNDFERVVMSTFLQDRIISNGDRKFNQLGQYMEPGAPDMLTLKMLKGTRSGLKEMHSILLSESLATALFSDEDPINKVVRIDDRYDLKVTGVYENLPKNSDFNELTFIAPWNLYIDANKGWLNRFLDSWRDGMIQIFVQVPAQADMARVENKIQSTIQDHVKEEEKVFDFQTFLHPMEKWHLYNKFENGYATDGQIQFVWLFGIIGVFVLLLACINFMNLSTARSEKRAKEVGIRKSIGSVRNQLVNQFFSESILITSLAFILSLNIVLTTLPWFNQIADKQMNIPWTNEWFWISCVAFIVLTGLIAGSYPALYLSSFQAVSVLKGTFRAGRFASIPRQVLVVLQFTVSVTLIIGTIVVYQQIQYTMERAVGYNRDRLIYLNMKTSGIHDHFEAVRNELIATGAITDISESSAAASQDYAANFGTFEWKGKDPNFSDVFGVTWVTPEYGKTVGWEIVDGRDFSKDIESDRNGMIINESAVKYMGLEHPVGEIIKLEGHPFTILGVVKDLLVGSPYESTRQAIYMPMTWVGSIISIKLNPAMNTPVALEKVRSVFKAYEPAMPFDYEFADEQYARKFINEVRVGKLASVFAGLAIIISCLGLFGLASFVAEQRTKEIGIRKVVGASVFNLWKMLSKDFVILVIIACIISIPSAYHLMQQWLNTYEYRTDISWWVFGVTGVGALMITLATVSYQAITAALMNPVKSLRSE